MKNIYDELFIAMEAGAEDITGEATSNAATATKGSGGYKPDMSNRGDIDTNTDDLLGTKDSVDDNTSSDSDTSDADASDVGTDDSEDTGDDDGMEDSTDDGTGEDGSDGNDATDDPSLDEPQTTRFEIDKKIELHKSMNDFYDILIGNLETLGSYEPSDNEEDTIKIINGVKDIFEKMKDIIQNILAYQFKQYTYAELMKKFITLTNAYDTAVNGLESHFDSMTDEDKKKKPLRKRIKKESSTPDPDSKDTTIPKNRDKKQKDTKKKDTEA